MSISLCFNAASVLRQGIVPVREFPRFLSLLRVIRKEMMTPPSLFGRCLFRAKNTCQLVEEVKAVQKESGYMSGVNAFHFTRDQSLLEKATKDPENGRLPNYKGDTFVGDEGTCRQFVPDPQLVIRIASTSPVEILTDYGTNTTYIPSGALIHAVEIYAPSPEGLAWTRPTDKQVLEVALARFLNESN